ncbi:MAG: hypothetical protein V7754_06865 [Halioglobus sp.]
MADYRTAVKPALLSLLLLIIVSAPDLRADAVLVNQSMWSPTIVEFYIDETGVRAELEIGVEGVAAFKNLLPDIIYRSMGYGERPANERITEFFQRQLVLLDENGRPMRGELLKIGPSSRTLRDPFNGTPLPIQDDAPEVIRARLNFTFNGADLPEQLGFIAPAYESIGFIAYHKGVAINDFRYLTSGYQLKLDWNDPWYSAFEGRKFRRQNYAPMTGFIYIEPFEVRKEIIARPKDLQRWVDLGLAGKTEIPIEMQAEIKQKVADFLALHQPVSINGAPAQGILDSVNFLERTMTSSRVIDPPQPLSIDAAILGTIFVYPQKELPDSVTMNWDLWDDRIQSVPAVAVDEVSPMTSFLEPGYTQLEWINFIKQPFTPALYQIELPAPGWQAFLNKSLSAFIFFAILALVWLAFARTKHRSLAIPSCISVLMLSLCTTAAMLGESNYPDTERGQHIVGSLLHNIYRAFDYRDEGDIYDVLQHSVSGELLTDIYLETKRSLVLANQGGAKAKVKEVTLDSLQIKPGITDDQFVAEANWTVHGSVGHWGHIHQRNNRYQALLDIAVDNGQWKLQKMTVLLEERL